MARVVNSDSPDLRERWPECPPGLAECVRRGLARDRSNRFASAADFATALRSLDLTFAVYAPAVSTVRIAVAPSSLPTRRWTLAGGGVLVVAAGILGMCRSQPIEPPASNTELREAKPLANASPSVAQAPSIALPGGARRLPAHVGNKSTSAPQETLASVGAAPSAPPLAEPALDELAPAAIPIGSKLLVRIMGELRTDRVHAGQLFDAELAEPLKLDDREAVAGSARIRGVIDAVVAGAPDRLPSLQLSLVSIEVGGRPVSVRTARYEIVPPPSDRNRRVLTIVIGAAAGAAIGGATAGGTGAAAGAAVGAALLTNPSVVGTAYLLGNVLTFKLAVPLRLQPGTL